MLFYYAKEIVYEVVWVAVGSIRQYAAAASAASACAVSVAVGAVRQYACAASAVVVVGVGSRHRPNHPGLVQVVVVVASIVVVVSLVVLSLHPNQPG